MARAAVIVPARDEAETVAETVAAALQVDGVEFVVVVDDGSRDDTARLARRAGARVLAAPAGPGKGAALEAGLAYLGNVAETAGDGPAADAARPPGGERLPDAILFLDADLGRSAAEAALLLAPVLSGDAEMTIATFPPVVGRKGGFGLVKGFARAGIHALGARSFPASAPLSGQRAIASASVEGLLPIANGYGVEVALTIRALRRGLRVVEVPTTMSHRHTGRDVAGFAHRGRQFLDVALTLARLAFEPAGRSAGRKA
jgi:hypothetical protein